MCFYPAVFFTSLHIGTFGGVLFRRYVESFCNPHITRALKSSDLVFGETGKPVWAKLLGSHGPPFSDFVIVALGLRGVDAVFPYRPSQLLMIHYQPVSGFAGLTDAERLYMAYTFYLRESGVEID